MGLTDDDEAEWYPLDDAIKTIDCWKKSKHMLCNFHALTLAFFEKICPKLPHKRGGTKRELAEIGNAYGKLLRYYFYTYCLVTHMRMIIFNY